MLAPVAYIDHTTSPIRSCICQCKNAVSLQFHFSQLKFQADRRVLPVVPVGRRPYGTCGVSSLNLVSQPHGRLRLRGPCTWFVLLCDFFLCISSWKLYASTFQNFSDLSWYFRFWRFYARIFSSCSLGKKIHNKNYVRRLCLSGTTVPRWTRPWSQPLPPTHLQESKKLKFDSEFVRFFLFQQRSHLFAGTSTYTVLQFVQSAKRSEFRLLFDKLKNH